MIIFILIFALILRLISINQSLWLDEAINVLAVRDNSLFYIVTQYAVADFHPPGYFIILWSWTTLLGYSELVVRLPSVIFGLATIYIVYLIGKKLFSVKMGLLCALLLAVNPLHIYYSQEARMYSYAAFAVMLNFYYFIVFTKTKQINLGYIVSIFLVLSSDYLAILTLIAQPLIIMMDSRTLLKKWFLSMTIPALLWVWWIPLFFSQFQVGVNTMHNLTNWRDIVGSAGIKPLVLTYIKFIIGRISHSNDLIYALLFAPVGILYGFIIYRALTIKHGANRMLTLWFLFPLIAAWGISFLVPIYSYFRVLFLLPVFLLIVSSGIYSFATKIRTVMMFLVIGGSLISSMIYLVDYRFQREDWKGLVSFLQRQENQQAIVIFETNDAFSPFIYYDQGLVKWYGGLSKVPATTKEDLKNLDFQGKGIYLVEYLVDITDPQRLLTKKIEDEGYRKTKTYDFTGIGFVHLYQH